MSNRPMKPAVPGAAMPKRNRVAPSTTGTNRPTMGDSAFHLVDDASASDVRAGFLAARPEGKGTDQSMLGIGAPRSQTMVETNGPQFAITASRGAQAETYSGTLANGRLMRPATSTGSGFRASAASYGPTGPGEGGRGERGSRRNTVPNGSWKAPNRGRTSGRD